MIPMAFLLHFEQMVQRKIDAMTDEDWAELERVNLANEEWTAHNPSLCAAMGPKKIRCRAAIVAGPLGFYGSVSKVFFGQCRDTIEEALNDAVNAAELIEVGGLTGIIAAYHLYG